MPGFHVKMWTAEERSHVASLILDGKSCRAIGSMLDLTRNAVIGRIHRDKDLRPLLTEHGHPARTRKAASKPKPPPKPKPTPVPKPPAPPPAAARKADPTDWGAWEDTEAQATRKPPAKSPKPLMDLGRFECRFPVLENAAVVGGYLFCSEATRPEEVYCGHHGERCHTPVRGPRHG